MLGLAKLLILVVEDNFEICALYQYVLQRWGCQLRLFSSGADALALALQERPDVILTDLMMPGMDGLTFIECIREQSALATVPLIVISAMPEERLHEALQLGATKVLAKPLDPFIIRTEVLNCLAATSDNLEPG